MKKLKKSKKLLLIFVALVAIVVIGIAALKYKEYTVVQQMPSEAKEAYQQANNILDNAFVQNEMNIIPFIYQNADQTITKSYVTEQFKAKSLAIKNPLPQAIVTGTKIETNEKTYTSLVYGDVDGDGHVDSFDAQAILLHYVSDASSKNKLTGVNKIAANVENDSEAIDAFDAQRILAFYVGNEKNLLFSESSGKEQDTQKPVITLKGENPQKIKLGEPYVELGATVTDNVDKNVKLQIDTSKLQLDATGKTKQIGTYVVYYNAKDASGNEAITMQRTVIVEDYVKNIEITAEPTKTTYEYGENIELDGGKITVTYASGKTETILIQANMISGYDSEVIGHKTVTVTYGGQTTTFDVEITPQSGDYVKGIEIVQQTIKKDYKIGQTIDLSGAKFKRIMNSGAKTSEEAITQNMINVTTLNTLGENTVTVTYKTTQTVDGVEASFTDDFTVQVTNYIKKIEITTPPTNTTYKYNQPIQTTGMVVNAIKGDNTKVEITAQVSVDVTTATMETNEVTVSYLTSDTINSEPAILTAKFPITVQNYITDIEITKAPDKTSYVEGQAIDKTGMIVKAVKANGNKEESINLSDIEITPNTASQNTNTITASYKTTNTIDDTEHTYTKTFNITLTNKIQNVNVTKKDTTGYYRYDTIPIANIKSGENEEDITTSNLSWEILDSNNQSVTDETIAKVLPVSSKNNGIIDEIQFISSKIDTYTVTLKVTSALGDIITATDKISVKIKENPKVTKITIGDIQGKFRVGGKQRLSTSFFHEYFAGEEPTEIGVEANRIEITGFDYILRDKDGNEIDTAVRPLEHVKSITIEAQQTGTHTLIITVDKGKANEFKQSKTITVLPAAQLDMNLYGLDNVTLYKEMPTTGGTKIDLSDGTYMMKFDDGSIVSKDSQGYVYTAIPFAIEDDDQKKTTIYAEYLTNLVAQVGTNDKLSLIDNKNQEDKFSRILLKGYKKQGDIIEEKTGQNSIDYIGIALVDEMSAEELRNGKITITYGNITKKIDITIPRKEITNINVNQEIRDGIRYSSIKIAEVNSAENEEAITENNLSWEIFDGNDQPVTDETIAKITPKNSTTKKETVEMYFTSSVLDTYTIIPKVTTSTGRVITGTTPIPVTINESQIVDEIVIGDIEGRFQHEQTKRIEVEFLREYQVDNKQPINVAAKRITIEAPGYEYKLLDASRNEIIVDENAPDARPEASVKYISLKAVKKGEQTITVIVDKTTNNKKASKTFTIIEKLPKEVKMNVINNNVDIYKTKPANNDMVKDYTENGYTYVCTLVEIWLEDADGNKTYLTGKDLAYNYETVTDPNTNTVSHILPSGKVSFIDNGNDPAIVFPQIVAIGYNKDKEKATMDEPVKYVGISLAYAGAEDWLADSQGNKGIKVYYDEMQNPLELGVNVIN